MSISSLYCTLHNSGLQCTCMYETELRKQQKNIFKLFMRLKIIFLYCVKTTLDCVYKFGYTAIHVHVLYVECTIKAEVMRVNHKMHLLACIISTQEE